MKQVKEQIEQLIKIGTDQTDILKNIDRGQNRDIKTLVRTVAFLAAVVCVIALGKVGVEAFRTFMGTAIAEVRK